MIEKSCGGIVYIVENKKVQFLLIQSSVGGHWGFPKGHVEENETEEQTALREIYEETGLQTELTGEFREEIKYSISESIDKQVIFFLAESKVKIVNILLSEVKDFKWVEYTDAINLLSFENMKDILSRVYSYLRSNMQKFKFKVMNKDLAEEMDSWKYDVQYFPGLGMQTYLDSYDEATGIATGPADCKGYAVFTEDDKLLGLFEYYLHKEFMEIGLALNPSMIGKGLGVQFVTQGIEFAINKFDYKKEYIKLNVSVSNIPAINVYKKVGFETVEEIISDDKPSKSLDMRKYLKL